MFRLHCATGAHRGSAEPLEVGTGEQRDTSDSPLPESRTHPTRATRDVRRTKTFEEHPHDRSAEEDSRSERSERVSRRE